MKAVLERPIEGRWPYLWIDAADMLGIFPSEATIIRLAGAILLQQNDEGACKHLATCRNVSPETLAASDGAEPLSLPVLRG